MHRKRHLTLQTHETSLLLERSFWDTIDTLANRDNKSWQSWVRDILVDKPADIGRATWIRTTAHNHVKKLAKIHPNDFKEYEENGLLAEE